MCLVHWLGSVVFLKSNEVSLDLKNGVKEGLENPHIHRVERICSENVWSKAITRIHDVSIIMMMMFERWA